MEGITKARTMKTAEEFLKENGISFSQTSKDVFGNELLDLMEQFRKEGMQEAKKKIIHEAYDKFLYSDDDNSYYEWLNSKIKEA